jgi:hypothetical protein
LTEVEICDQPWFVFDAPATMDLGSFVVLIVIACVVCALWIAILWYLIANATTFLASLGVNRSQSNESNELHPNTRIGCLNGLCYLPMFATRDHPRMIARLGHFPTIIALASIPSSHRRKIKGKLVLIEDGVAHFEKDKDERLVWEVIDEFVCRLDLIGSREVRVVSSQPPEGYRYSELFHSNYRNDIIRLLGPYPHLQDVVNIDVQYRTEFVGVLWQKWTDKYVLEKEMDIDVWAQLGKCVIRPEATID